MAKVFFKKKEKRNLLIYFGIFYFQHEIWGAGGGVGGSFCFCFLFLMASLVPNKQL